MVTSSRSVHAFINKKTGELHKAASFKAPVKEPRFDLRIITEREFVAWRSVTGQAVTSTHTTRVDTLAHT